MSDRPATLVVGRVQGPVTLSRLDGSGLTGPRSWIPGPFEV